ncbi:uncharacterized protein LOC130050400 [Ostrea edulis]|uniref:uncharacterized protein LOC130050400 n=1 Tax=Ostrea edulis TaxID=37623 RepID=UPI0024AF89A0|nr:uncharacterized protein LOC130050400 [Ostrea edulis]
MSAQSIADVASITEVQADSLYMDLGLDHFMYNTDQCNFSDATYGPATSGWNNECLSGIPTSTLGNISNPAEIRCHIASSCDQISCCMYLAPVKRHVETVTKFNFCRYKMEARIDKLKDTTDLLDYSWGSSKEFNLNGVVRWKMNLEDLVVQRKYVADLQIQVCYEAATCTISENVLVDTKITQSVCDWTTGLQGFGLSTWLTNQGLNAALDPLSTFQKSELLKDHEIENMMQSPSCSRTTDPIYSAAGFDGWNSNCTSPPSLRNLTGEAITCYNPSICSAAKCCLDVSRLSGQSVEVSLVFSQCRNYLDITVEKITVNHYLHNFTFGMLYLHSVFVVVVFGGFVSFLFCSFFPFNLRF